MFVRVRVEPDSKRERLIEKESGVLDVAVREPAEGNRATKRVIELVAAHYNVPRKAVRLVGGAHRRSKLFDILST